MENGVFYDFVDFADTKKQARAIAKRFVKDRSAKGAVIDNYISALGREVFRSRHPIYADIIAVISLNHKPLD